MLLEQSDLDLKAKHKTLEKQGRALEETQEKLKAQPFSDSYPDPELTLNSNSRLRTTSIVLCRNIQWQRKLLNWET